MKKTLLSLFCLWQIASIAQCPKVPQTINSYYNYWGVNAFNYMQLPRIAPGAACRDSGMVYYNPPDQKLHWWTGTKDTTFVGGAGSTPNLQQVTDIGNVTTDQVKITRDTTFLFHGKLQGLTVGDSALAAVDSIILFGDSWTFGSNASPITLGYPYLLAGYYNATAYDRGVSGWTMVSQSLGTSMIENLNLIPVKNGNYKFLTFMFGINDAHFALGTSNFTTAFIRTIDTAIARGWTASQIIVLSPGYNNGTYSPGITGYVTGAQAAAAARGTQYVNIYAGMIGYGGPGNGISSDSIHPTNTGHNNIAQLCARGITGFSLGGNATFNGVASFNRLVNLNNNLLPSLSAFFLNPFYLGAINSGINVPTIRSQIGRLNSATGGAGLQINVNPLDVTAGRIQPDSIQLQGWSNGGRLQFGLARDNTNFMLWDWQGGFQADGTGKYVNSLVKYTFNGGGSYVNGPTITQTFDSVYGSIYVVGDNVFSLTKQQLYKSGNFKVGDGVNGSDRVSYWASGNYSLGRKEPSDGITYTPYFTLHTANQNATFGTDSTNIPSAALAVNSTTGGFAPPRMTTAQKNAIGTPGEGLVVYDLTLHKLCVFTGTVWETVSSL